MRQKKYAQFRGLSIFHRMLFSFIGISLFIISVMGTVYYFYAKQRVSEFQKKEIEFSLNHALDHFNSNYNHVISSDLTLLEAAPSLDNFLSVRKDERGLIRFDIEKMFFRLAQAHKDLYRSLIFFDAFGQEKIVIKDKKRGRKYSSISQYKKSDDAVQQGMAVLFNRLKEAPPGSILFEGPFSVVGKKQVVAIGIGKREPEIAGFGGVIMALCGISDFISYLSSVTLLDVPVAWVFGRGGDIILAPPYAETLQDPPQIKVGHHNMAGEVDVQDQLIEIYSDDCTFGVDPKSIFQISLYLPPNIHATLMHEIVLRGLFVTMFVLSVAVGISFLLANQFTKPIIALSRASRLISDGNKPETPSEVGGGEIGELSRNFYSMADNLQKSIATRDLEISQRKKIEKSLQKAHDELEKRVKERTLELQETHEKLMHSEKLSAIGQLSASIAHEFNNPLAGITNVINGLKRRASYNEDDGRLIDMALEECIRIKNLIKSLQDFNRPSSGAFAPVDIHAAIDGLLILAKNQFNKKNITVKTNFAAKIPQVKAVSDQIKQVLLNLINNAVYACKEGGTITIGTGVVDKNVFIEIQDTGHGIHPKNIGHIFEPFFTTRSEVKGTGLGLSISYGIIKSHGGDIRVNSEPDKGATFTITLPLQGGEDARQNDSVG